MTNHKELSKHLNSLRNHKYQDIFILGTGPSLDLCHSHLRESTGSTLVISLKQSLNHINCYNLPVLHLTNPWNLQVYEYSYFKKITRIYYHDIASKFHPSKSAFDFKLTTSYKVPANLSQSALALRQFEQIRYDKINSDFRPMMPGIFPEALMLAWFFNPKSIYLYGVDYSSANASKYHIYDKSALLTKILKLVSKPKVVKKLFYKLNMRTEYSTLLDNEKKVAIPGICHLIEHITQTSCTTVHGWKHSIS